MDKNVKELSFKLKIQAIEIIEFNLSHCDNSLMPLDSFKFNINLNQSYFPSEKLVFVLTNVDVLHSNNETKLGSIKINCIFKIEELAEYYNSKTKKVNLPEAIVGTLNSVSLSTCRGVMASQFKGTILHNAVLPLMDPKNLTVDKSVKK